MKYLIIFCSLFCLSILGACDVNKKSIEDILLGTATIEIDISTQQCISRAKEVFVDLNFNPNFILEDESIVSAKNDLGMFSIECIGDKNTAYIAIAHLDMGAEKIQSFISLAKRVLAK